MDCRAYLENEALRMKLVTYAELLSRANSKARLTGPSDPAILLGEYIADALFGLPFLEGLSSFVDVGTGGGLPGIVWGICRPDMSGRLLDSVGKKIALVQGFIEALGCRNLKAVSIRSEDFARTNRENFDVATAKALAAAPLLAEYLAPLVKVGGRIVAFKGSRVDEELETPGIDWSKLGLSSPVKSGYEIAGTKRFIVIWEKIRACSRKYPRRPGVAAKEPWYQG